MAVSRPDYTEHMRALTLSFLPVETDTLLYFIIDSVCVYRGSLGSRGRKNGCGNCALEFTIHAHSFVNLLTLIHNLCAWILISFHLSARGMDTSNPVTLLTVLSIYMEFAFDSDQ